MVNYEQRREKWQGQSSYSSIRQWCALVGRAKIEVWMSICSLVKHSAPHNLMCSYRLMTKPQIISKNVSKDLTSAEHHCHVKIPSINELRDSWWRKQTHNVSLENELLHHILCIFIPSNGQVQFWFHFSISISFMRDNWFLNLIRCDHKTFTAAQLENITRTLTQMLEGYDIRLRPDFGGNSIHYSEWLYHFQSTRWKL